MAAGMGHLRFELWDKNQIFADEYMGTLSTLSHAHLHAIPPPARKSIRSQGVAFDQAS